MSTSREFLDQVYAAEGDPEALRAAYDDWAESYETDVDRLGHRSPTLVAAMLARHLPAGAAPVLDAGAGTGIMAELLRPLGYPELIGLDLSPQMLAMAERRGGYAQLTCARLGGPLDFADGQFAAVVSSGVMTVGHAPPESFDELLRVTRPGGLLVFSLTEGAARDGGFDAKLAALSEAGRWQPVEVSGPYVALPYLAGASAGTAHVHAYRKS